MAPKLSENQKDISLEIYVGGGVRFKSWFEGYCCILEFPFSMYHSIFTFNFDLILESFGAFGGQTVLLGVKLCFWRLEVGSKTVLGYMHVY